jgi:glycosyltransferase involved in cell wall biosynthesis
MNLQLDQRHDGSRSMTDIRTPEIGVVVPTRDRPAALRHAVDSVLGQTFERFEVIVVDDGSEKATGSEISELDPRIVVVRNDVSRGAGGARNRGVQASTAPIIAFLDDDDVWLPNKLDSVMSWFSLNPHVGAVSHRVGRLHGKPANTGLVNIDPRPVRRFLLSQPPHLSGVAVRSDLHRMVEFDEAFAASEDLDYLIRLAAVTPFAFVDEVCAVHGEGAQHPSMISIERRIESRRQLRVKHGDLFDRRADAFHLMRLGHLYRKAGRRSSALRAFARSAMQCPTLGYAWRGVLLAALPASMSKVIGNRSRMALLSFKNRENRPQATDGNSSRLARVTAKIRAKFDSNGSVPDRFF